MRFFERVNEMRYVLFPHGGSGNHGCEAIVRTTKEMIDEKNIVLFSDNAKEDYAYLGNDYMQIEKPRRNLSRKSFAYVKAFIDYHIRKQKDAFDALNFAPVISKCKKDTTLFSVGGDNYCYGENEYIYLVNRYAHKAGARTVLWGCSVEPSDISEMMAEDLRGYDLIVARESISYEALMKINNKTVLRPDPAFTLEKVPGIIPKGLDKQPYIGINISPLIQSKESQAGITKVNYVRLITGILENTDYNIALIPHVVWSYNDDRLPLSELYEQFADTQRVFILQDQNCMQLKDVISKCAFFIGARTHATIAAYSTLVPTLVVGYSVKARGIAKDIFGTDENYVIPVQKLKNKDDLWNAFCWMKNHEADIRMQLEKKIPDYIAQAKSAKNLI